MELRGEISDDDYDKFKNELSKMHKVRSETYKLMSPEKRTEVFNELSPEQKESVELLDLQKLFGSHLPRTEGRLANQIHYAP